MFAEKVALVTGAARGIGLAAATLLAEGGAKVVLADVDEAAVQQAAAGLPGEAFAVAGNLREEGVPEAVVTAAIDAFGALDIVVNNAGYTRDRAIHTMSDDEFQEMLDIHAVVPFRVLRAAAPHLREPAKRERAEGTEVFRKVVNVTSIAGTMGNAGQANYSTGKSGVVGLTKTLAKEWGQFKINVNAVAFGFVETRLTAEKTEGSTIEVEGRALPVGVPAAIRDMLPLLVPLGRSGTTEEAAGGIAFLCSPWSNYVTGQVLNVTGGLTMGMES